MGNGFCMENDTECDTWVTISTCCVLILLELGLQSREQKVYKHCMGSKFCSKMGTKSDTEDTVATHCRLVLLEV